MFSYYKNIDESDLHEIQNNEEKICHKFKEEFEGRYSDILKQYGIHSEISIGRWIDDIGLPWKKMMDIQLCYKLIFWIVIILL